MNEGKKDRPKNASHLLNVYFSKLLGDAAFRQNLQNIAWQNFPFTDTAMAEAADQLRLQALTRS